MQVFEAASGNRNALAAFIGGEDASFVPIHTRAIQAAAKVTPFRASDIIGPGRSRDIVQVRWAVMHALRSRGMTLSQIGRRLGGRDHTTVMHGLIGAASLIADDPLFGAFCAHVEAATHG